MPTSELSKKITMIPAGTMLDPHPDLCKPWPIMQPQAFRELTERVTPDTLQDNPIVLYEGYILDGRHRFQAAQVKALDCPSREYVGDDPREFVIRENGTRRHSPLSLIAQCVVAIRDLAPPGRPANETDGDESDQVSRQEAAAEIGASVSTVDRAIQIERGGLGDQVRSGEMTSNQAITQIRQGRPTQGQSQGQGRISRTPMEDDRPPDEFDTGPDFDDPDFGPSDEDIARAEAGEDQEEDGVDNFPDFGGGSESDSTSDETPPESIQDVNSDASPDPADVQTTESQDAPENAAETSDYTRFVKADLITFLQARDQVITELTDRLEDQESLTIYQGDQGQAIQALQVELRAAHSQVSEWMSKYNDAQRQIQALEMRIQELTPNA